MVVSAEKKSKEASAREFGVDTKKIREDVRCHLLLLQLVFLEGLGPDSLVDMIASDHT